MKQNLLFLLFFVSSLTYVTAQDIIVKHDGKKLDVRINYITESSIVFTSPGSATVEKLGKAEVEKVIYKSGRVESISEKVVVNGKKDWEKIVITNNPLSVVGLAKKGEIHVKTNGPVQGISGYETRDLEKIKKQAAEMGAHVIVLDGYDARAEISNKSKDHVVTAYGYQ